MNNFFGLTGLLMLGACATQKHYSKEIQLTHDSTRNHELDNNDNFSPDDEWLVFDTRTGRGGVGGSPSVERVNIKTGEVEVLFEINNNEDYGPGAGAASYHPFEDKVIFIHGLSVCTPDNPYQQWRRTGTMINAHQPGIPAYMDSRDMIFPFTAGTLRGGTHRHEWSRDGKWVGFTYNDAIMKKLEDSTGIKWNLRTIGVSNQNHQAIVPLEPVENVQGSFYSVLVVRVVPDPQPGTDEISNAAGDSWVGSSGYIRPEGTLQRARAFLGKIVSKEGKPVDELFIVDIPDSLNVPGPYGPLEGTATSFPMPPKGTVQRRLSFTAETAHPGCGGIVRASADGSRIAFLAKDPKGIQQVYLISPNGGQPVQCTQHPSDVQSGVRWCPDDQSIIYVWDNSILRCKISDEPFEKRYHRLTARTEQAPNNIVWSNDGRIIAFNRPDKNGGKSQIFIIRLK